MSETVQQYRAFVGRVIDATSGAGVSKVRVEIVHVGVRAQRRVATTDASGYFSLPVPRGVKGPEQLEFRCSLGSTALTVEARRPGDGRGTANEPLLLRVQLHSCATPRVEDLADPEESLTTGRSIRGVIRGRNGGPDRSSELLVVEGLWVRGPSDGGPIGDLAPLLGEWNESVTTTLSPSGGVRGYTLHYASPLPQRVLIRVKRASDMEVVGISEVLHAPKAHARIDVVLDHPDFEGSSEFTETKVALEAAGYDLETPTWALSLTRDGLVVVAADTSIEMARVSAFVAALRLSAGLPAWTTVSLERAEYLYAFARSGILPSFDAILRRGQAGLLEAIEDAAERGVIRGAATAGAQAFLNTLFDEARDLAFSLDTGSVRGSWGPLLNYAIGGSETASLKRAFIELLRSSGHDSDNFWGQVQSGSLSSYAAELKRCVELANVCAGSMPFVQAASAAHTGITARGLIDLSDAQLDSIILSHSAAVPSGLPEGLSGLTIEDQRVAFRDLIRIQLEALYPSAVVRRGILDDSGASQDLKDFLTAVPEFDLDRTPPSYYSYVTGYADALPHLLEVSRLFRLAPPRNRYATIQQLRGAGMTSASRIARMSLAGFQVQAPGLMADVRETVYRKAYAQAALGDAMLTRHHPGLTKTKVAAIKDMKSPVSEGDWGSLQYASLFGPLQTCACDTCRSVLSPAAYLYELSGWVEVNFPAPPPPAGPPMPMLNDAYRLTFRRPDLASLELSCANVSEALPYIDLVNEVLEDRVAGVEQAAHNRTSGTLDERLASPEHVLHGAYTTLASSHRGNDLPFHRPLAEQRVFLAHLGVPRLKLLTALQHFDSNAQALTPSPDALAAERLGLSSTGFSLIASGSSPADPRERWGLTAAETLTEDWNAHVGWVRDEFLPRARLAKGDLSGLLFARAANPILSGSDPALANRKYVLEAVPLGATAGGGGGTVDPCDDGSYRLLGHADIRDLQEGAVPWPTPADLTTMDRFLRLRRATGWSTITLDRVIERLGLSFEGSDDSADLHTIAQVRALAESLGAPVEDVLSLWATLDTWAPLEGADDSAYARLFLRRELDELRPVPGMEADPAWPWPFALNETRTELVVHAVPSQNDETLARHHVSLRAALGASPSAWEEVVAIVGDLGGATDRTLLCRENLSEIHRRLWLGRKLGLSPAELQEAAAALDLNPFASPEACSDFLQALSRWQASPLPEEAFAYLLAQAEGWTEAPTRAALSEMGAKVATALGPLLEAGEDNSVLTSALRSVLSGLLGTSPELTAWLAQVVFPAAYVTAPTGNPATYNLGGELRLLDPAFIRDTARDAEDTTGEKWTLGLASLELMSKVAVLARALDATAPELAALLSVVSLASNPQHPPIDLLSLPCAWSGESQSGSLGERRERWLQTVDIFRARPAGTEGATWAPVIQNLYGVNDTALKTALATATEGTEADVGWLVDHVGPEDGTVSGAGLLRIGEGLAIARRLGVSVSTLWSWASGEPTPAVAAEVVAFARAGHEDLASWVKVARPLRDALRERQRDALVSQLLFQPPPTEFASVPGFPRMRSADDLYAYLLIDPSMSPCALTTRIRQAACSVQLYVHRALAGTDPADVADRKHASRQWAWLKTYRVWEAAKKVYLWPENWISPDLRDDKTPLFEAFEGAIQQGAVDDAAIDDAVMDYVRGLHDLSSLEPVAIHQEQELWQTPKRDAIHLLARTRSTPMRYFYRRFDAKIGWTPWEKVEGEMPQEHAVLVTSQNRLFLMWPVFTDEQEAPQSEGSPALHRLRVRVAWSEKTAKGWTPVQTPDAGLASEASTIKLDRMTLHLRCETAGADLEVSLFQTRGTTEIVVGNYPIIGKISIPVSPHRVLLAKFRFDRSSMVLREVDDTLANAILDLPEGSAPFGQRFLFGSRGAQEVGTSIDESRQSSTKAKVTVPVLRAAQGAFTLLPSANADTFVSGAPFVLTGPQQSWLVRPVRAAAAKPGKLGKPAAPWHVNRVYLANDKFTPPILRISTAVPSATLTSTRAGTGFGGMSPREEADKASWYQDHAQSPQQEPTASSANDTIFYFEAVYHSHTATFLGEARRYGVRGGLLGVVDSMAGDRYRQAWNDNGWAVDQFTPATTVQKPYPRAEVDFSPTGAYSRYNWELFLHAPMRIAQVLSQEFQYERAIAWLETVFLPTPSPTFSPPANWDGSGDMWLVKPLAENPDTPIWDWTTVASAWGDNESVTRNIQAYVDQVAAWRSQPFNPYAMARLRGGTFQRAVVMQYLDTLIAWADDLFRRDTIETLNEAANLYLRAAKILGPRPLGLGSCEQGAVQTLGELGSGEYLDSEVLRNIEDRLRGMEGVDDIGNEGLLPGIAPSAYFSVPHNPKLMAYWDTLADRFFKLRHCRNLDGVVRQLPLWDPPIDPSLLVRAGAAGVDVADVVGSLNTAPSNYRFTHVLQRAYAFAGSVRALGGALLSALEKKDAEALGALRAQHEVDVLERTREIRQGQVNEAREQRDSARQAKRAAEARLAHFSRLLAAGLIPDEKQQIKKIRGARGFAATAQVLQVAASSMALVPESNAGMVGVFPLLTIEHGGTKIAKSLELGGAAASMVASDLNSWANTHGIKAGHARREEEWKHAQKQAEFDLAQAERQEAAAELRLALAQRELQNHDHMVANAIEVKDHLESKFTRTALYDWMVRELQTLYRQSFNLAFQMAKQAEGCFERELGVEGPSFIRADAWDSQRKGLLASERLQADLERMEAAYLKEDRREFELTKQISFAELDGRGLVKLIETGEANFTISEPWFDLDFPGHYFRRIQAVTLSLPTVSGSQAGVHAEVSLTGHVVRKSTAGYNELVWPTGQTAEQVATSSGQDDAGLFSLDYRDPRYLPFERRGAVSKWDVAFVDPFPSFDRRGLSDVALSMRYTARQGDAIMRGQAGAPGALAGRLGTLTRAFYCSRAFTDAWRLFVEPEGEGTTTTLLLPISDAHFPAPFRGRVAITEVELMVTVGTPISPIDLTVTLLGDIQQPTDTLSLAALGDLYLPSDSTAVLTGDPAPIEIVADREDIASLPPNVDLIVILHYEVSP